jgi:hypothetical protein
MGGTRPEKVDPRHLGISATAKGFIAIWVPGPTFSFPI